MINIIPIPDPLINSKYEKVYAPSDDTFLLLDYFRCCYDREKFDLIELKKIENVLDMGTGTGIIAIFFQMLKSHHPNFNPVIYASDLTDEALECAKSNELLNHFKHDIRFIQSNLFESFPNSLKHSFNIIVFNPPYLPSSELEDGDDDKEAIDQCWDGGPKGYEVFSRFIEEVRDFMNPENCSIYYISSSRVNLKELNEIIEKNGFKNQILNKKHIFFEDIILSRLTST